MNIPQILRELYTEKAEVERAITLYQQLQRDCLGVTGGKAGIRVNPKTATTGHRPARAARSGVGRTKSGFNQEPRGWISRQATSCGSLSPLPLPSQQG